MLVIAVPSQVKALTGEEDKGFGLFVLFVVGGAVNLIASIFLGYACDHVYSPFGRRYSWVRGRSFFFYLFFYQSGKF